MPWCVGWLPTGSSQILLTDSPVLWWVLVVSAGCASEAIFRSVAGGSRVAEGLLALWMMSLAVAGGR
jgi:hypothetical protein